MNEIHNTLDKVLTDNKRAGVVLTDKKLKEIMFMTYGYSYDETRRAQEALQKSNKALEAGWQQEETKADKKPNYWVGDTPKSEFEKEFEKLAAETDARKALWLAGIKNAEDKDWGHWNEAGINSASAQDWDAVRPDMVNSPAHYMQGGIETIDFIEAKLTPEEFRGYLKGNVLKYASRMGNKGSMRLDAGKAAWYSNRIVETN
jgi:hypothetical protein